MGSSKLPPKPDFAALQAAAPVAADRRTRILALIGSLNFNWSNNESLFIYVLMLLLDTDEASAALVFATLNTTRARLDLIQRLAKIKISDRSLEKDLDKLIERFNETTQLRNELNHSMYTIGKSGEIAQTQSMRIIQTRSNLTFGETKAMDEARVKEIDGAVKALAQINRDIWDLLARIDAHLKPRAGKN